MTTITISQASFPYFNLCFVVLQTNVEEAEEHPHPEIR
jgi:hypothetical protein